MNKITIEINGETLTIPDDEIDAVTAELTERFGKRDGFVEENMQKREWISTKCLPAVGVMRLWQTLSGLMAVGYLSDDKRLVYLSDDDTRYLHVSDCVFHQSLPPTVVGKRDGQTCLLLKSDGGISEIIYSGYYVQHAERGRIFHIEAKPEAQARDERDLAEQRLRKAYLAVTGGAEIEGAYYVPWKGCSSNRWTGEKCNGVGGNPYRFATSEQAAAFGRDNGDDLIRMMTV